MIVCNTMTQGQLLRIESSYKKCDSVVLLSLSLRMSSENPNYLMRLLCLSFNGIGEIVNM